MGMTSLGREWKGIKRELDKVRRAAKKEAERKAEAELRARGYTTYTPRQSGSRYDQERDVPQRRQIPSGRNDRDRDGGGGDFYGRGERDGGDGRRSSGGRGHHR